MRRRSGFTLIEVLMALLIFAMTAVVLGSAYVNVLNSYEVARRGNASDGAVSFARSQLLAQADLPTAQAGEEFDDVGSHVKWTAEIEPTNTADLFSVTFTCAVSGTSSAGTRNFVENFMLLRPTWSDQTVRAKLRQDAASRIAQAQGKQAQ